MVRCTQTGNQPWPHFQNGIRERSIILPLSASTVLNYLTIFTSSMLNCLLVFFVVFSSTNMISLSDNISLSVVDVLPLLRTTFPENVVSTFVSSFSEPSLDFGLASCEVCFSSENGSYTQKPENNSQHYVLMNRL